MDETSKTLAFMRETFRQTNRFDFAVDASVYEGPPVSWIEYSRNDFDSVRTEREDRDYADCE